MCQGMRECTPLHTRETHLLEELSLVQTRPCVLAAKLLGLLMRMLASLSLAAQALTRRVWLIFLWHSCSKAVVMG